MTTNENDEQIGAEMKELAVMTTISSISMAANTRFSKFQKRFLVKITLTISYIAKVLWTGTRGSICFCKKAVANDDLLSLFKTSRKVANGK